MKNLIIFSSTYGYTEKCAQDLAGKLKAQTETVNIKNAKTLDMSHYDNVIIGGSIYMGQLNKELKGFMESYKQELLQKRLGFFICCGFPEQLKQHIEMNIPKELLQKSVATECFGGQMDISKMGFMHKMITKMVTKATAKNGTARMPEPMLQNIEKMAQAFNNA
ncbi:MAG: flavodoxin domain-containing protein [Clostridia bacterium]|nr:flavodoxin domain-containing protein [Clostridia bacterium]